MLPPEQLAEIAELAGGFIHEIKNHVSTVNLNLQLLADDFADPQTPRERRAKQRFDRSQEIKADPTPIEDVIAEMVDFVGPTAKAAGLDICVYTAPGLPPVNL